MNEKTVNSCMITMNIPLTHGGHKVDQLQRTEELSMTS